MSNRIRFFAFLFLYLLLQQPLSAATSPFTVVIDAGHGGKDPGTLGSSSKEKDIVLAIALKVGNLINLRLPDVKVIYTRSGDEYPELYKRAEIANKAKANLFISIHADHAESSTVRGASIFTLGQNRTSENMAIAKRENSVILLEDNYKERYEGFDPNSPESYIMFEFMQSNYMDQSIRFASVVQNQFKKSGRVDRGIRQDVFLVLRNTSMPSVLIEVGFLSNLEEERYLKSASGQDEVAKNIVQGFEEFKVKYEEKTTSSASLKSRNTETADEIAVTTKKDSTKKTLEPSESEPAKTTIVFKVQIMAVDKKLKSNDTKLKGISAEYFLEKGLYKYTVGNFKSFDEANSKRQVLNNTFPGCFVIAFKNGEKINIDSAKAEVNK